MVTGFVLTCSSGLVSNVVLVGWVVEASGLLVVSEANSVGDIIFVWVWVWV